MKIEIAKTETIHFIGIGGIGMSGLSLIMNSKVFNIQGSGVSIYSGDHLSIPASSIPVMDIRSMNRSIAVLTKDHILILDVK